MQGIILHLCIKSIRNQMGKIRQFIHVYIEIRSNDKQRFLPFHLLQNKYIILLNMYTILILPVHCLTENAKNSYFV